MNNLISLDAIRELRKAKEGNPSYQARVLGMDKLELLDEMMRFQEERSQNNHLTPEMMIRGQILFRALEESAETEELRALTRSYRRHLKYELDDFLKSQPSLQKKV